MSTTPPSSTPLSTTPLSTTGPVRLALITEQLLAPVPGGTGRYTYELAAALAGRDDLAITGWTAWHHDPGAAEVPGLRGPRRLPLPRRALTAAWERGVGPTPRAADLVHAPTPLLPPRRSRPLVCTVHDTVPWTHPETLTPRGVGWHRRMIARAAAEADAITVPSHTVAAELRRRFPDARIEVLGAGVSPRLLRPPSEEWTRAVLDTHDLTSGYWLTLATAEPRKGLDVLLDALVALGPKRRPVVVVGAAGWGGVDPVADAARRGLPPDAVRWLGRIDDDALGVVLRQAELLVMPSRSEGFGLPVAEAMGLGTAVVCSDAPALVEVGGSAVRLTPRGDAEALAVALDELSADADARTEYVAAGRIRAAEFTWTAVAERAHRLYTDLLSASG